MFNNERYITPRVMTQLPLYLQNLIWYMVESMNVLEKDYLQVFELKGNKTGSEPSLQITHRQEEPYYESISVISMEFSLVLKIYCIDNGIYTTMLLAEEY
jgi:hypothetical protein